MNCAKRRESSLRFTWTSWRSLRRDAEKSHPGRPGMGVLPKVRNSLATPGLPFVIREALVRTPYRTWDVLGSARVWPRLACTVRRPRRTHYPFLIYAVMCSRLSPGGPAGDVDFLPFGTLKLQHSSAVVFIGTSKDSVDVFLREEPRASQSGRADENFRGLLRHEHGSFHRVGRPS